MSVRTRARLTFALAWTCAWATFTGYPYLQNLTESSVVVRWETATMEPAFVEYGLTTAYGHSAARTEPDTIHELVLAGLAFDTSYHYRVISGPDTSADAAFRSSASFDRPFRFLVHGDTRTDSAAHQVVIDRMLNAAPGSALALHVGDLTENATLAEYGTFFRVEQNLLARVASFPVPGNHELGNMDNWYRFFVLPGNERYYSVRVGNATFHAVNLYEPFTPGSQQHSWLESELRADGADSAGRHVFVWLHEPPYTTSAAHSSNLEVREHLCPLFERYGVGIVFCGHVHAYERSLVNGVQYVTTGGGGAPLHWDWLAPEPWTVFRLTCYEFVQVDVHGDTAYCRAIKPDGEVVDSFACEARKPALSEGGLVRDIKLPAVVASPSVARGTVNLVVRTARPGHVRLAVRDAAGRLVAELLNKVLAQGEHLLTWSAAGRPAGLYYAVLSTNHGSSAVPVVLTR